MSDDPLALFAELNDERDPFEAIRRLCGRVRSEAGEQRPPIALNPIWRRLGAEVRYDETSGDGSTSAVGDGFIVRVPAPSRRAASTRTRGPGHSWRRARFTLAHELGHVMLMRSLPPGARAATASATHHEQVEELCNAAAAELLMPASWLAADLVEGGLTQSVLLDAYDRYLVSWQALAFQVAEVVGGTASVWRTRARDGETDVLRVRRSSRGGGWLPDGLSERFLSEQLISRAVRDGVATCEHLRSSHATKDVASPAIAVSVGSASSTRRMTPQWQGITVPDERVAGEQVILIRLPPERTAAFETLRSPPKVAAGRRRDAAIVSA